MSARNCLRCGDPLPTSGKGCGRRVWCRICKREIVKQRDRERGRVRYAAKPVEPYKGKPGPKPKGAPKPKPGLVWQRGGVAILRVDLT